MKRAFVLLIICILALGLLTSCDIERIVPDQNVNQTPTKSTETLPDQNAGQTPTQKPTEPDNFVDLNLEDEIEAAIKKDFWNSTHRTPTANVQENVMILAFYGKYVNDGKASYVMMITATDLCYTEALVDYTVAGVDFHFCNGNTITVCTKGEDGAFKFVSLPEAYEANLLTAENIQTIANVRNGKYLFLI